MNGRIEEHRADHGTIRFYVSDRGWRYTNHECRRRFESSASAMMRWCARSIHTRTAWDDADMRASDVRELRNALEDIAAYVEHVQRELDKLEGVDRVAERVKALRNVTGRTPAEAVAFIAKADELEGRAAT